MMYIYMKTNICIALGAAGCVLGATGIGVGGKALSFGSKGVGATERQLINTVSSIAELVSSSEMIFEYISSGAGNILGDGSHLPNIPISSKPFALTREVQLI